jgi:hypothetical protein
MLPIVFNLLAAERIVLDRPTGRCDLHGVFHALALPLPSRITFAVYYVLGAVHEPFDLGIYFDGPDDARLGAAGRFGSPSAILWPSCRGRLSSTWRSNGRGRTA